MNQNSPSDDLRTIPGDDLDGLLSRFFKAQAKSPWPSAPSTAVSEPSVLAASRNAHAEHPRNQPVRDSVGKSRYTLAVSVALLLGACWYLANGFQTGEANSTPTPNPVGNMLRGAGAGKPAVLEEIRKDDAIKGTDADKRTKIELP